MREMISCCEELSFINKIGDFFVIITFNLNNNGDDNKDTTMIFTSSE